MIKLFNTAAACIALFLTVSGCGNLNTVSGTAENENIIQVTDISDNEKGSADYIYTIQDVIKLQSYLLISPTTEDLSGKPYDLNGDGRLNISDLCLMKQEILCHVKAETKLLISVNGQELTASLADSTAAKELAEKLKAEPVTVMLNEYGGFEKVGKLPWSLTRTDENIETNPCDIMLYQGNQMTIFYNSNSWSYTKLGSIENTTGEELKALFGEGDITATLSLKD